MNICKCGKTPQIKLVQHPWATYRKVVCECGECSDEYIYEGNAVDFWNEQHPITKIDEAHLLHDIESKVHGQRLSDTDELLGNYAITDKGEMALKDIEIAELKVNNAIAWHNADWFAEACDAKDKVIVELKKENEILKAIRSVLEGKG